MANSITIDIIANFTDNASAQIKQLDGLLDKLEKRSVNIGAGIGAGNYTSGSYLPGTTPIKSGRKSAISSVGHQMATSTIDALGAGFDNVFSIEPVLQGLRKVGSVFGGAAKITAGAITAGGAAIEAATITTGMSFEAGMSKVKALSGASDAEMAELTSYARSEAKRTKFTATETADALGYMGMAGWKVDEMEAGLPAILNLAAAGGTDLGTTSDIVTDAITAFGLGADQSTHFSNVMAAAAANSNTSVGLMGETFKYSAPIAGMMGYSIDDVALATGLMASSSVKGSMAGTALRTGIANLTNPTKTMQSVMNKYGLSVKNADGSMKSLKEVIDDVRTAFKGNANPDDETGDLFSLFGKYGASGWAAIVNASDEDYQQLYEKLSTADDGVGAAQAMSDIMMDNLQGDWYKLTSAWSDVMMGSYDFQSPYLRQGVQALTAWVSDSLPGYVDSAANYLGPMINNGMALLNNPQDMPGWMYKDYLEYGAPQDTLGKLGFMFDEYVSKPVSDWWNNGGGRENVTNGAESAGNIAGTIISDIVNGLTGGEIGGAAGEVAQSFVSGFADGISNVDWGGVVGPVSEGIVKGLGAVISAGFEANPGLGVLMAVGLCNSILKGITGKGALGWLGEVLKKKLLGGKNENGTGGLGTGDGMTAETVNITAGVVNVYGPINQKSSVPSIENVFQPVQQKTLALPPASAFAFIPSLSGALSQFGFGAEISMPELNFSWEKEGVEVPMPEFNFAGEAENIEIPMPTFSFTEEGLEITVPVALEGTDPETLKVTVPVEASEQSETKPDTSNTSVSEPTKAPTSQTTWQISPISAVGESISNGGQVVEGKVIQPVSQEKLPFTLDEWNSAKTREKRKMLKSIGVDGEDADNVIRAADGIGSAPSMSKDYGQILQQAGDAIQRGAIGAVSLFRLLNGDASGIGGLGELFRGVQNPFETVVHAGEYTPEELAALNGETVPTDLSNNEIGLSIMNAFSSSVNPENMSFEGLSIGQSFMNAIAASISPENMSFEGLNIGSSVMNAIAMSISPENMSFEGMDIGASIMNAIAMSVSPENMSFEGLNIGQSIMGAISQSLSPENMSFEGMDIGASIMSAIATSVSPENMSFEGLNIGPSIMSAIGQSLSAENMSYEGLDIGPQIMSAISASFESLDLSGLDIGSKIMSAISASLEGIDVSGIIAPITAQLDALSATEYNISIGVTDNATPIITTVQTSLNTLAATQCTPTISANDAASSVIASVSAALATLDGSSATVTINVRKNGSLFTGLATGTSNAPEGLAVINDQMGVSDPTELVEHNGTLMEFAGRNVVVPLSSGDKVYTAAQRRRMLDRMPHYAGGKNNDLSFTQQRVSVESGSGGGVNFAKGSVPINLTVNAEDGDIVEQISGRMDEISESVVRSLNRRLSDLFANSPRRVA
ncbi:MAG: phage tail tape measure protein [bacterium]|nr:phage tail tape measure protein [bacterium]